MVDHTTPVHFHGLEWSLEENWHQQDGTGDSEAGSNNETAIGENQPIEK